MLGVYEFLSFLGFMHNYPQVLNSILKVMSDTITSAADHRERVCVSYKVSLTMKVDQLYIWSQSKLFRHHHHELMISFSWLEDLPKKLMIRSVIISTTYEQLSQFPCCYSQLGSLHVPVEVGVSFTRRTPEGFTRAVKYSLNTPRSRCSRASRTEAVVPWRPVCVGKCSVVDYGLQ